MNRSPDAEQVAHLLEEIAALLEAQNANPFRVQAYRDGAKTVRTTDEPVVALAAQEDYAALKALPNIGEGLARVIVEVATTGRSTLLDELKGQVSPADVLQRVPGIGEELAQRIVDELGVQTLEELEIAAYDGRLAKVEGIGQRRLQNVRNGLAGMLGRSARRHQRRMAAAGEAPAEPSVSLLLKIDEMYRQRAAAGELPRIAPRRFNPEGEAWLPIMRTTRDGWEFTALFSNTAQAHRLEKTDDWVVIYFRPAGDGTERQRTVVTETRGPQAGQRVVRGREGET